MSQNPAKTSAAELEPLEHRRLLAAGAYDPSFGGGAAVTIGFAEGSSVLNDLLVMPDGGILAGGYCIPRTGDGPQPPQLALAKYSFFGNLDPSFGNDGQLVGTPRGIKHALQLESFDDGSILVLGSSVSGYSTRANLLVKLTPQGRVDTAFGRNGRVNLPLSAAAVKIGPGNHIFVAGQLDQDGAIARYSPRGGLDLSFGSAGMVTTRDLFTFDADTTFFFDSLAIDSQGRVYAGGTHRDTGSGPSHGAQSEGGSGRSLVRSELDVRVVRLLPDSTLDAGFAGRGFFSAVSDAEIPRNGAAFGTVLIGADDLPIVATASSDGESAFITRLGSDGTPRPSFGDEGVAELNSAVARYPLAGALAEQADGKILFAGVTERDGRTVISSERLTADGEPDSSWGNGGVATVTYKRIPGEARVTAIAPDGTIVLGGVVGSVAPDGTDSRRFTLARLLREDGPAGQLIPKTLRQPQGGFVFDVVWRADDGIDFATLDGGDLRVLCPDGVHRRVRLTWIESTSDGRQAVVRYRLPAPDGVSFTRASNGLYVVKLQPGQVADASGNFASRRVLGTIRVRIA